MFIMVATGTGIAPYRAFWRRQFMEDVPNYKCAPRLHVTNQATGIRGNLRTADNGHTCEAPRQLVS